MAIRPTSYYTVSFFVSLTGCVCFVLSANQLYGDENYIHNFLGHTSSSDTGAIPVGAAFMTSLLFLIIHIAAHARLFRLTELRSRYSNQDFVLKFGFYKNETKINWMIRLALYILAAFVIYDYLTSFYRFYLFDFLSHLFIVLTLIIYSVTITNLIANKRRHNYADIKFS